MSYNKMKTKHELEAERAHHPVWRGIGFLFMLFIPILGFGISDSAIKYMKLNLPGFVIPEQLRGGQNIIADYYVEDFWAVIMMSFLISILLYGLYSVIAAAIHWVSPSPKLSDLSVKGEAYTPKRKYKQRRR